ncbi:Heterokaryon incompatibility protein 6, OR allele [Cytospora mali]|uniref:Heterokaryon incompatibility protein 6, OR allele n=1 Tax=Cytospora mali TaxID=578113 RepID=A0A194W0R6_CYTMA|nr:Heterokaryon incompatibility protein 6, OR allele [Valsa mali]
MSAVLPGDVFQHEPLPDKNWIRLVTVNPDPEDGKIACTVHSFGGNLCPEYVALSYLWGDPTPKHTIYVNGLPRKIHENLWHFFHRAWRNEATEYFWIDSICLDQDNHSERNEQVQRMGDIYSQAHHVLSWIGESASGAEALLTLAEFGQHSLWLDEPLDPSSPAAFQVRDALSQLMEETYWERVWIFQEIICARQCFVAYGPVEMRFEDLVRHLSAASDHVYAHRRPATVRNHWIFRLAGLRDDLKCSQRLAFVELVAMLSNCTSTREVDRIYGLLGLASRFDPDFDPRALEVNYDKPLVEVFWDIACLSTSTLHHDEYLWFLGSMPIWKDRRDKVIETASFVGSHLERYSNAATTPERWRSRARVAHKIYEAITLTYPYTYRKGLGRAPQRFVQTCGAWKAAVKYALSDVHRHYARPKSLSWHGTEFTDIKMGVDTEPPWPRTGHYSQPEGVILGLSLLVRIIDRAYVRDRLPASSLGSPKWFCDVHMPRHVVAEKVDVVPFTFCGLYTAADLGMTCAAHSTNCVDSSLSLELEGEGLVLELRDLKDPSYEEDSMGRADTRGSSLVGGPKQQVQTW